VISHLRYSSEQDRFGPRCTEIRRHWFPLHHTFSSSRLFHDPQPRRTRLHSSCHLRSLSRPHVLRSVTAPCELLPAEKECRFRDCLCWSWSRECNSLHCSWTTATEDLARVDLAMSLPHLPLCRAPECTRTSLKITQETFQEWRTGL